MSQVVMVMYGGAGVDQVAERRFAQVTQILIKQTVYRSPTLLQALFTALLEFATKWPIESYIHLDKLYHALEGMGILAPVICGGHMEYLRVYFRGQNFRLALAVILIHELKDVL